MTLILTFSLREKELAPAHASECPDRHRLPLHASECPDRHQLPLPEGEGLGEGQLRSR